MSKRDELICLISKFIYDNTDEVIKEFGSWEDAFNCANINLKKQREYSDDEIIQIIKSFYKTYKNKASFDTYSHLKLRPSRQTIIDRFGSWNNALRKSGVEIINDQNKFIEINEDDLKYLINEAKTSIDGKLTMKKYDDWARKNCKPSVWTIIRRFGTWKDALEIVNND